MRTKHSVPRNIDDYIGLFPPDVRAILQRLRTTIRKAAPDAQETISYHIPAFKQNGILVYFGGFKKHVGFFPTSNGIEKFKHELAGYKGAKGSVQFPFDQPMPYGLISKIVKFRVKENRAQAEAKAKKAAAG
jgi:uncharacterized protein YdhG (YjbR/CyaY superfamily)